MYFILLDFKNRKNLVDYICKNQVKRRGTNGYEKGRIHWILVHWILVDLSKSSKKTSTFLIESTGF